MELNTTAADAHVPEIERCQRVVKEQARATINSLPFDAMPKLMVTALVYDKVMWINSFPPHNGVSTTISLRTLVTGHKVDFAKHCRLEFGNYVQTHEIHDNTMIPRTVGAIALCPTGNLQGGYHFLNLRTGKGIVRNRWTVLPMPTDVIDRVNHLGRNICYDFKPANNDDLDSTNNDNDTDNTIHHNTNDSNRNTSKKPIHNQVVRTAAQHERQ